MPIKWDKDKKKKVIPKQPVVQQPKVETLRSMVLPPLEQTVKIVTDNKELNRIISKISGVVRETNNKTEQMARVNANLVTLLLDRIGSLEKPINVQVEIPPDNNGPVNEWDFEFIRDHRGLTTNIKAKATGYLKL